MRIHIRLLMLGSLFVSSLQYCMDDVGRWVCAKNNLYVRTVFDNVNFWYTNEIISLLEKCVSQVQSATGEGLDIRPIEQAVAFNAGLLLPKNQSSQQVQLSIFRGSYFENSAPDYLAEMVSLLKQYASYPKKEIEDRLDIRPFEIAIIKQAKLSIPQNQKDWQGYCSVPQPSSYPVESPNY